MIVNQGISSSGEITETGIVTVANKAGLLFGYTLKVGSDATSVLFKSGGTGGTILVQDFNIGVTAAGDVTKTIILDPPVVFPVDIFATLAGTGATVVAYFKQIE